MRIVFVAKKFGVFLADGTPAGMGRVGFSNVCVERTGVHGDRPAVALRDRRIEGIQNEQPSGGWAGAERDPDRAAADVDVSGRVYRQHDSKKNIETECG